MNPRTLSPMSRKDLCNNEVRKGIRFYNCSKEYRCFWRQELANVEIPGLEIQEEMR